jgi:hypothetical protein
MNRADREQVGFVESEPERILVHVEQVLERAITLRLLFSNAKPYPHAA